MAETGTVLRSRMSRSCDQCKARKVRCIRDEPESLNCKNCMKRGHECHFSHTKRKLRRPDTTPTPSQDHAASAPSTTTQPSGLPRSGNHPHSDYPPRLYVDYLLENRHADGVEGWRHETCIVKAAEHYVASATLSFFSETRIRSVSARLGHDKIRNLIETIGAVIHTRMIRGSKGSDTNIRFKSPSTPEQITPEAASTYIDAYFDQVHPLYPFLDRKDFEKKSASPQLPACLANDQAFSALYHTVLALGCQYTEGGSFDPGKGKAWKLFQVALGLMPDLLMPREPLVNVQAITAMSIFAMNFSCMQIEDLLLSEAARMVQKFGYNRATSQDACHRSFWVVYMLEKTTVFFSGRSSDISDSDVGCPIPEVPEAHFGGCDWFLSSARFARLVSRAYDMLFSVTATMKTPEQYFTAIDEVSEDLEKWRKCIPKDFRPGEPFRPQYCRTSSAMLRTLRTHFFYHSVIIALCRLTLHVGAGLESQRMADAKKWLMNTARQIIENTRYIDAEPYTPIWIIGVMPLSALFILFDFVVHNPFHPETNTNLALLDVAAGYFSRLEYATGGSLPASLLSDFAHIARQFVRDVQSGQRVPTEPAPVNMQNGNIKSLDGIPEASQEVACIPTQFGLPPQMNMAEQIPTEVPLPYTDQLFYPTTDLQPFVGGDIGMGFDITGLFDAVLPNFSSF